MATLSRARVLVAVFSVAAAALAGVGAAANGGGDKVLLCHGTVSEPNPYVLISVDESALNGHFDGTAPGHGPFNNPDRAPVDGGCDFGGGGGGEE